MSSMAGVTGTPNLVPYCASKVFFPCCPFFCKFLLKGNWQWQLSSLLWGAWWRPSILSWGQTTLIQRYMISFFSIFVVWYGQSVFNSVCFFSGKTDNYSSLHRGHWSSKKAKIQVETHPHKNICIPNPLNSLSCFIAYCFFAFYLRTYVSYFMIVYTNCLSRFQSLAPFSFTSPEKAASEVLSATRRNYECVFW